MALNIMPTHVRCNKNKKRLDTPGIENSVYIKKKNIILSTLERLSAAGNFFQR